MFSRRDVLREGHQGQCQKGHLSPLMSHFIILSSAITSNRNETSKFTARQPASKYISDDEVTGWWTSVQFPKTKECMESTQVLRLSKP
jgi:hypothetical protein